MTAGMLVLTRSERRNGFVDLRLRALGWEPSQHRLCKNTGICLPTLFAFDLLFWCRAAVWLRCYLLLPNHALGMYDISHTATSYPLHCHHWPHPIPCWEGGGGGVGHGEEVEECSSHISRLALAPGCGFQSCRLCCWWWYLQNRTM